jgi:hypothetical protein
VLKEKNSQPQIPSPAETPFKNEGEIKTLSKEKKK